MWEVVTSVHNSLSARECDETAPFRGSGATQIDAVGVVHVKGRCIDLDLGICIHLDSMIRQASQ